MKMRTQKTFTFLLLLSFLFAHVSESAIPVPAITDLLNNSPSLLKKFSFLSKLPRKPNGSIDFAKLNEIGKKTKERIDDVGDALEILQNYGFLDSSEDKLDNIHLSFAVWRIQKNFNLQPTGKLDPDTITIISKPRCDFPNKIDGTSTLTRLANKKISLKPWWRNLKKNNLTYAFGNDVPVNVKSLFQATFNRWSNEGALKFTETKSFKDSDILIAFINDDGKDGKVGSWDCISGKR